MFLYTVYMTYATFRDFILSRGRELYRDMPWRDDTRPYYILVSELMLQQTQVSRVMPKFTSFIQQFSDETVLANANLADVIRAWQGLGYNRRAKYLSDAAKMITNELQGVFPQSYEALLQLPGVGKNTAGAIRVYAYNEPHCFVETNIRTVYIHHFFKDHNNVSDADIMRLLDKTIDRRCPRTFYWALMDYGSYLKSQGIKTNARSRGYVKQSPLRGSLREMRGILLGMLAQASQTNSTMVSAYGKDARFVRARESLVRDGLIYCVNDIWSLTGEKQAS